LHISKSLDDVKEKIQGSLFSVSHKKKRTKLAAEIATFELPLKSCKSCKSCKNKEMKINLW